MTGTSPRLFLLLILTTLREKYLSYLSSVWNLIMSAWDLFTPSLTSIFLAVHYKNTPFHAVLLTWYFSRLNLLWKQPLNLHSGGQLAHHSSGACSQTPGTDQHTPQWWSRRTGWWDEEAAPSVISVWLERTAAVVGRKKWIYTRIKNTKNEATSFTVQL